MLRRGFLTAMIGAPLVAKSAAEEVISGAKAPMNISSSRVGSDVPCAEGPSDAWMAFDKVRHRENKKRDAMLSPLPPHIAAKKSWSETYKRSVAVKEAIEFDENFGYCSIVDEKAAEAILRKMGISW